MRHSAGRFNLIALLTLLAAGVFGSLPAWADCASPAGAVGSYKYDSATKTMTKCVGTVWTALPAGGQPIDSSTTPSLLNSLPIVGKGGGNIVTLCNVPIGERCGGGFYIGDGNLVSAPGGCADTTPPTCPSITAGGVSVAPYGGRDVVQKRYGDNSTNFFGSRRFGYAYSRSPGQMNGTFEAFTYCGTLNYNGYTDWYLPNFYETELFVQTLPEIGGVPPYQSDPRNAAYLTATLEDINGGRYLYIPAYGALFKRYSASIGGGATQPESKNNPKYIRCVRRN